MPYIIEKCILLIIYWVFLTLMITLTISIVSLFFTHLLDTSQFKWIARVYGNMCESLTMLLHQKKLVPLLLGSMYFVFMYYRQGRGIVVCIKTLAWIIWYVSLELPVRLMLDPPSRSWSYFQSSSSTDRRAILCAVFYPLLLTVAAITCSKLLWIQYEESENVPIGLIYVLFYAMAFTVCVIGLLFNWTFAHRRENLFTVDTQDDENLHNMSITRQLFISYCTQYIQ